MLARLAPGYRIDLCAWDWSKRWKTLDRCRSVRAKIHAARGYQPTGLFVTAGQTCAVAGIRNLDHSEGGGALTSQGGPDGCGQLEAVLLKDFQAE